jgi:hypothetical protein
MKRSQLRELVLEAMKGYSPQIGQTKGGTTDDFRNILTAIAKGRPEEEDSEEEKARRGHAILDKANPDNVARITRGEKPIYEGDRKLYSKEEVINYIENNPPVKYYKIGVSKESSRVINDPAEAIQVVQDSPISQFELDTYGKVIQFSAPFDAGHGAAVRAAGPLD